MTTTSMTCPRCDGTREEPGAPYHPEDGMALCLECNGRGEVPPPRVPTADDLLSHMADVFRACDGDLDRYATMAVEFAAALRAGQAKDAPEVIPDVIRARAIKLVRDGESFLLGWTLDHYAAMYEQELEDA